MYDTIYEKIINDRKYTCFLISEMAEFQYRILIGAGVAQLVSARPSELYRFPDRSSVTPTSDSTFF